MNLPTALNTAKVYEIINPSDVYTLVSDDFLVAAAATLILGKGAYGLQSEDGSQEMPPFLLGGADEFCQQHFGDLEEWLDDPENLSCVGDCLDTVMSLSFSDRGDFDQIMKRLESEAREKYRADMHEENRSSTNDIGAHAWAIAKIMWKQANEMKQTTPNREAVSDA